MAELRILQDGHVHCLNYTPGPSIRDILEPTDYRVRSACRGIGACGLCRIRIISGDTGPATLSEQLHLTPMELDDGFRLACQVRPTDDISLEISHPSLKSDWKASPALLVQEPVCRQPVRQHKLAADIKRPCGVAIDIGTTNLCLAIFDLVDGCELADRRGRNPQADFGADVLTRLQAATQSTHVTHELSRRLIEGIGEALLDISSREGFDLHRVIDVRLVGNTAMLALLAEKNSAQLLQPNQWATQFDCTPTKPTGWANIWGIHPQASVIIVPPLAGFVGSDLLAGLVAVQLTTKNTPALFIDCGTNTEIALWDGQVLWVTSAAGGPAFESSGMRHGVPAENGAIYRVLCPDNAQAFNYLTINDEQATGICGTGLVDLLACLRKTGRLTAVGRFTDGSEIFEFSVAGKDMTVNKKDIDLLQRAKAALGVGVHALCAKAGLQFSELQRICVAGAFGRVLDIANAQSIGLLPNIAPERIELVGNTALHGCSDILLLASANETLAQLRATAQFINLAEYDDFDDVFLTSLYLQGAS
ncbi:MAG: ASKHA domain-containing protein [Thiohalomonadaceae bacterium]